MNYTILENGNLLLENVTRENVLRRNFSGNKNDYGKRSIAIRVDEDLAQILEENHYKLWDRKENDRGELLPAVFEAAIKYWPPREDGREDNRNPEIYEVSRKHRHLMTEDEIDDLDVDEFEFMDIECRVYPWSRNNGRESGYSTVVKTVYFILKESPLKEKYASIPEYTEE